jgi:four helix bundle protein
MSVRSVVACRCRHIGAIGLTRVGASGLTNVGADSLRSLVRNVPVSTGGLFADSAAFPTFPVKTPITRSGIQRALSRAMRGARHYSELTVWKLADELRIETLKLTSRPAFARNLKAQTQAEDAVNSICRNTAEGFGCESHGQFAWFLRVARRSLNELQDACRGAEQKGYVTSTDLAPIRALTRRLYPALNRFIAYLDSTPDYKPNRRKTRTKRKLSQGSPKPARIDTRKKDRTDPR